MAGKPLVKSETARLLVAVTGAGAVNMAAFSWGLIAAQPHLQTMPQWLFTALHAPLALLLVVGMPLAWVVVFGWINRKMAGQ